MLDAYRSDLELTVLPLQDDAVVESTNMTESTNCDDGFSRDAGSPNTIGRTEPAKRTRAVVQIDQRGDLSYYADGDIDYLVIDERCPRDRVFALSKEQRVKLQIRVEFLNIFNRVAYGTPSTTNPQALTLRTNPFPNGTPGALSSGFGFVNTVGGAPFGSPENPRTGQFIARITF